MQEYCEQEFSLEMQNKELKYLVLVIYDISNDKRRRKFSKYLQGFGFRVQRSSFEAVISKKLYEKILQGIPELIKEDDNVRVYKLLGQGNVKIYGNTDYVNDDDVLII